MHTLLDDLTTSQVDLISGDMASIRRAVTRYREILPAGAAFPTSIIYWDYATKNLKVMEITITRNAMQNPTVILYVIYALDGVTVSTSMTETITYANSFESTRTRTVNS